VDCKQIGRRCRDVVGGSIHRLLVIFCVVKLYWLVYQFASMTTYIAFLRGINVGGNLLLPMAELKVLCAEAGFKNARTYIQSGNVIFQSTLSEDRVRASLEKVLLEAKGKEVAVAVRSAPELRSILDKNPFPKANPSQVIVLLLRQTVQKDILAKIEIPGGETIKPGSRELYIHYPNGMGKSKLRLPSCLKTGTARNINTISKLVELASVEV
jgi:uncharacterized protein (DUF1697 family)